MDELEKNRPGVFVLDKFWSERTPGFIFLSNLSWKNPIYKTLVALGLWFVWQTLVTDLVVNSVVNIIVILIPQQKNFNVVIKMSLSGWWFWGELDLFVC